MVQQDTRIALVSKTATACEVNQDGAGEREQQKRDINVPASPQRPADHSAPALEAQCLAVGQRAGYARDEHEYFRGIAEAVVPQRQPTSDVVRDMVKKDEPQRDASAGMDRKGKQKRKNGGENPPAASIGLSDEPMPLVDIEFHQAFVAHFQQQGLASFLIREIGAPHDLVGLERLLPERIEDILTVF